MEITIHLLSALGVFGDVAYSLHAGECKGILVVFQKTDEFNTPKWLEEKNIHITLHANTYTPSLVV